MSEVAEKAQDIKNDAAEKTQDIKEEIKEKVTQTAEEIDKKATENAQYDVEKIKEWFEKKKEEFKNIELNDDDYLLAISSLLSAGVFMGSRVPRKLSWLVEFLSGGALAYTAVKLSFNLFKRDSEDHKEKKHLENVKIIEPEK